ncbi:MAG: YXWGXW repeat-containing protein [Myxococcales bacterium]|nr:YXWGXW repeat-containing protein [Myxococcales bacterium]
MRNRLHGLVVSSLLVGGVAASGCYGGVHGHVGFRGGNAISNLAAAAVTVAAVAMIVSSPPPVVTSVEYYDYGSRPGQCWVNGRYVYSGNQWHWQNGYFQQDQPGYYWVQGYWGQRGNDYVWVEGQWAQPRAGYTYVDGYWDYRGSGYVWMPGSWEAQRPGHVYVGGSWTTHQGRRVWSRGGWQRDDGRAEWNHWRVRGRGQAVIQGDASNMPGGVYVAPGR